MGLIPATPALNLLPQAARCKSPLDCLPCRSRPLAGGGMSLTLIPIVFFMESLIWIVVRRAGCSLCSREEDNWFCRAQDSRSSTKNRL